MRARTLVGAVIVAVGIGLATPAAAPAAPACPDGMLCSWSEPGFVGGHGRISAPTGCTTPSYGNNRDWRSTVNNTTGWVVFYERAGCSGRTALVRPGAAVEDFGFTAVTVSPRGF